MKKWYYFYNEKGEVNVIHFIKPSEDMLGRNNYIIADEVEEKQGYDTRLIVTEKENKNKEKVKELKVEYVKEPLTEEENIEMLKKQNSELTKIVADQKVDSMKNGMIIKKIAKELVQLKLSKMTENK